MIRPKLRATPRKPAAKRASSPATAMPLAPPSAGDVVPLIVPADDAGQPAPPQAAPLLEPGRALALADFAGPRLKPMDRLIRLAYRLGVPGPRLVAPLRRPAAPHLLATVEAQLPGDKVAGMALRAGHFLVHGAKLPITQADFSGTARLAAPVDRVLHGFRWLTDLECAGPREAVSPVADRIAGAWLNANPKPPARPGKIGAWTVGNAAMRLAQWLAHAPLILSNPDKAQRARMLAAIVETARWLDRNVSRAEDGLAATTAWAAITAAGLLLPDGHPRRIYGEAGLIRAIGELLGDDGGVLSRSPLSQMEAIAVLVRLRACYRAMRIDPPAAIDAALALMVPPLLALTHGEGALSSWQGGWAVSAQAVAGLISASEVRTRPLREARQWGYHRLTSDKSVLVFDAAPPPLSRHARYGCASTLAFEFSHAGQRIVVNCGGAAAAGGLLPARLEHGLRATAAHSTLVIDNTNSTSVLHNGLIGRGVNEVEVARRALPGQDGGKTGAKPMATRIEASHDGYVARYGLTHRRILILRADGTELRGEDVLVPTGRQGKRARVGFAIRFHLGPGVEVHLSEDGQGAGLALPDGAYWQFRLGGGKVTVDDSLWADGDGCPVPVQQLVVAGFVTRGGGNFAWLLKKMN